MPLASPSRAPGAGPRRARLGADDPKPKLVEPTFAELPLGAIKPSGWLKAQLRLQADGLGGHLDEFWPDIKDSAWIGGKAEGWERTPYWLDGAIPLAFLLDDARLKAKVKRYVDYILDHQAPDGWLGPVGDNDPGHKPYDVWPLFVLFKALTQYQEATGDPRVIPAMLKCSKKIDEVVSKTPLYSWAHFRGADLIVGLYWLHEKTHDPSVLDLAQTIDKQSYDWIKHFEDFDRFREKATKFGLDNHGVNNGMGLKFGGMRFRRTGDPKDRDSIFAMLGELDRHHGQATGVFACGASITPGEAPRRGRSSARWSRPCIRSNWPRGSPATPASAIVSNDSPSTPSRRHSRRICAATSTVSERTRSSARCPTRWSKPTTAPTRTSTAWSRTASLLHRQHAPGLAQVRDATSGAGQRMAASWRWRMRRASSTRW